MWYWAAQYSLIFPVEIIAMHLAPCFLPPRQRLWKTSHEYRVRGSDYKNTELSLSAQSPAHSNPFLLPFSARVEKVLRMRPSTCRGGRANSPQSNHGTAQGP